MDLPVSFFRSCSQEFSCYPWCLSAVLQVFWGCWKPLRSLLLSVVPRFLEYAVSHQFSESGKTETIPLGSASPRSPKARVLDSSLSPWGRGYQAISTSILWVFWSRCKLPSSLLFSVSPRHPSRLGALSALGCAKWKSVSWAAPLKPITFDSCSNFFSP